LEFRSLVGRLPQSLGADDVASSPPAEPVGPPPAETTYRTITSKKDLTALVKAIKTAKRCAIHVENTDANGMAGLSVGIAIATAPGAAAYIPLGYNPELDGPKQLDSAEVIEA